MSATLRRRCADITSAGLRCKDTTKFADVQILSGKSFRSFKSFKGERRNAPTVSGLGGECASAQGARRAIGRHLCL